MPRAPAVGRRGYRSCSGLNPRRERSTTPTARRGRGQRLDPIRRHRRRKPRPLTTRLPRGMLWWPLVAVHAQHVEAGLNQAIGGLPVEVNFGVTAARRELEAVMRATLAQPFRDDLGVSFQDHGRVGRSASALSCQRNAGSIPSKRCRFPGTARPVNTDEHAPLMVRKGTECHRRPPPGESPRSTSSDSGCVSGGWRAGRTGGPLPRRRRWRGGAFSGRHCGFVVVLGWFWVDTITEPE